MKNNIILLAIMIVVFILIISCKKVLYNSSPPEIHSMADRSALTTSGTIVYTDSMSPVNYDGDSIERKTVLGVQLTNPYLIPNMQQAYRNLGITNVTVTTTNLYVRFLPAINQISCLDSVMDVNGIDIFDSPLDYQVLQIGDYNQDPSISNEQPTWKYAVVPANFAFPSGIQYQQLAQIHIPTDDYTAVETEAERLASIVDNSYPAVVADNNTDATPNIITCTPGFIWDPKTRTCIPIQNCPTGYYWNGTSCVPNPTSPPPPAPDARIPAGHITVDDTQLGTTPSVPPYSQEPLRRARVVARRWFKIERTYTDDNGNFVFTKRFKNKVRINVKFKNADVTIRCMRGIRLWQMLYPIEHTIGVYNDNKNSIVFNFAKFDNTGAGAKGNQYWACGTTLNAIQEYKGFAIQEGIGQPAGNLKMLLTNMVAHGSGSSPMFNKRFIHTLLFEFISLKIASNQNYITGGYASLAPVLENEVDVTIPYTSRNPNEFFAFTSDDFKSTVYHELTHTAQYARLGYNWYTTFVNAEIFEMLANMRGGNSPYGSGRDPESQIIALGESWAYHIEHYFTNKRYGNTCSRTIEQELPFDNGTIPGLSSHLCALENFDPNFATDPFRWIPKGLYYDMIDNRNESRPPVNDNVSGYSNQILFNAFGSNISTLQNYKSNLVQLNVNNQTIQVLNLFQEYGY